MPFEEILLDHRVVSRRKLMAGWGTNDAPYLVQVAVGRKVECCPYYLVWMRMVQSVYGLGGTGSIAQSWRSFLAFKTWMRAQDRSKGMRLDVALLGNGDRHHSPATCVFVSRSVANTIPSLAKTRGELPVGVSSPRIGKYRANCGGKHIGFFKDPHEAHLAWCKEKAESIYLLAAQQTDLRVQAALVRLAEELTARV